MLPASKKLKQINAFQDVAIPSAKDIYLKYGARDSRGVYTASLSDDELSTAVNVGSSTIEKVLKGQSSLQDSIKKDL